MQIDSQKVAVLIDRVEQLMTRTDTINSGIQDLRVQFAKIEDLPGRLLLLERKAEAYGKLIDRHNFILRVCGTLLLVSIGLIGWGWREGKTLYAADAMLDRRIMQTEFKLGITQPVPEGGK